MVLKFFTFICILALAIYGIAVSAPLPAAQGTTSARESARADLTGYWVSLVTEDWIYRSVTAPKGDYIGVPLNVEGIKVANQWDLAKDEANGEQCKPFGAAGLMRLPLRVHITWADDNTLKVETDAGQQTRLFHFRDPQQPATQRTWQGDSRAAWAPPPPLAAEGRGAGRGGRPTPLSHGSLKVVTRNLRPGYLRWNGVPYSENASLTEYYDRISAFGNDYLVVMTIVEDPTYLGAPFITTSHFKRESDGTKWSPGPCKTDPPRDRR